MTNDKIKVMTVFGTRPEAVKMAPLVQAIQKDERLQSILCVTAQHRQMLDQVLEDITMRALDGMSQVIEKNRPDIMLVHGDTTTTFVASLAAFYHRVRVGHVEAGLRTFDKYSPYPEEMNRKLTGSLADMHFAPTTTNRENLLREGIKDHDIYITGNTVIDALSATVKKDYSFFDPFLKTYSFAEKRVILLTAHRRENLGKPMESTFLALRKIVEDIDDIEIVYPVHMNPVVQDAANRILGGHSRIHLIDPVNVQDMHNLMARSYIIMTDSGGLQEEAPSLGKPVLVLRNETERPEAVLAGTVKLAGTTFEGVYDAAKLLLCNTSEWERMSKAVNPYGDGHACERIVEAIAYDAGISAIRPAAFQA
jgi:UDP-N-acetylglucosamine 2-epimerase (non-hydrolysing)